MSKKAMKTIAVTGVIGAGKSSVIEILKAVPYIVLDCDRINDELLLKGNAGYCKLVETFKDTILDETGAIDRQKMSDQIFNDVQKKKQAEAILHPLIKAKIQAEIKRHKEEAYVFVEVPLLFEVKWECFFDEVWVVASHEELLLERLMKYRRVSRKEAMRRLSSQIPQEEKVKKADHVLWNNSDKESLKRQIYDILEIEE